jgi:hypothetical protein
MSANKEFWERVKKTDPKRVKPITGKQYKGNSPQPYYMVERMTEEFGMCGIGWGINILNERMERLTENDVLHVAVVELWYVHEGKNGSITQVGQTKAAYKTNAGSMLIDEDAPKKSVTDALTKCMSYLGFAGDIFSGQWDDSKYVQGLREEFSEDSRTARRVSGTITPTTGAQDNINPERLEALKEVAVTVVDFADKGEWEDSFITFDQIEDTEERIAVWDLLKPNSAIRSKLKKMADERKLQKEAA